MKPQALSGLTALDSLEHSEPYRAGPSAPETGKLPMKPKSGRRLIRLDEVLKRTGVKRSTIYKRMSQHKFPRSVQITNKCVGWYEDEVDAHMAELPRTTARGQFA